MMRTDEWVTQAPEETREWAAALGRRCRGGEVFLLEGNLGAGKTCLVQGLARGVGVPAHDPVTSPTFVLHAQYDGRMELNHIDAYRLAGAQDVGALGFEDLCGPGTVMAVEWPGVLGIELPGLRVRVVLEATGPASRRIRLLLEDLEGGAYLLAPSEDG